MVSGKTAVPVLIDFFWINIGRPAGMTIVDLLTGRLPSLHWESAEL